MDQNETLEPSKHTISRRTVVKGAAWAAPAVVLTTALPAYAASFPLTVGASSAWYSCNNGTFEFYFNPVPAVTNIVSVTIQSNWAPFATPFTLTRSTETKDRQDNPARYLFEFQNPGGTSSLAHFTTLRWCALDQLRADNSILTVTYVEDGVTKTETFTGFDIDYSVFTMGNSQSCGICGQDGSQTNPGATIFDGNKSIIYDGKHGEWEFKLKAASGAAAQMTKIELWIPGGSCVSSSPVYTWTGGATGSQSIKPPVTGALGTCGSGANTWIAHYGANTGQNTLCASTVLYGDGTYFKITHANGYVETLPVPQNGNAIYDIKNVNGACSA